MWAQLLVPFIVSLVGELSNGTRKISYNPGKKLYLDMKILWPSPCYKPDEKWPDAVQTVHQNFPGVGYLLTFPNDGSWLAFCCSLDREG